MTDTDPDALTRAALARLTPVPAGESVRAALDDTETTIFDVMTSMMGAPVPTDLLADPEAVVQWLDALHAVRIAAALRSAGMLA